MSSRASPGLAVDLAMAVIASSETPLLLLDSDLTVVAASKSFCHVFQINASNVVGRPFNQLASGEWDVPQLSSLLAAAASGYAEVEDYELDLSREGHDVRRLVLSARKLDYADEGDVRLLLTVSDVTDARVAEKLKDDLLKEKAVLLRELQHRVANSLQIIAAVLMQSARKTNSAETRAHLHDAHQRVMSVAAVQSQLAASHIGQVALRPYFMALCNSIGASMIHDHDQLTLDVTADESTTSSDVSVSLGLIVTELVINALKHGFPNNRSGKITVDYRSKGADWTLAVSDNGIGMPEDLGVAKAGLGTSIVEALAKQLQASITVGNDNPGTAVSVIHTQVATVDNGAKIISIAKAV